MVPGTQLSSFLNYLVALNTMMVLSWLFQDLRVGPVLYSTRNSAQCCVAAWMGGEFGREWIHISIWLSPFAVHLKLSQIVNWSNGLPWWLSWERVSLRCRRPRLHGGEIPWRRKGNPCQYSCLENPHGKRSLEGASPWGGKESDMTE